MRFLIATRSIREHTEIWWSVRPHQAFPTVEVRICDAQPEFERAVALAGLMTALTAHYARAHEEGRPLPAHPHRLIEENFWRAIRWGMAGELIDLDTGAVMPARARIESLVEEVSDIASELGIGPVPGAAREADRRRGLHRQARGGRDGARGMAPGGRAHAGVGGRVAGRERGGDAMSEDEARAAQDAAAEYMKRVPIGDVVISTVQTLIELGYRRTGLVQGAADERDLPQTEVAIEALRALVPVLERLLEPSSVTALRGEIAQLQLAYARASEGPASDAPAEGATTPEQEAPDLDVPRPKIWTPGGEV